MKKMLFALAVWFYSSAACAQTPDCAINPGACVTPPAPRGCSANTYWTVAGTGRAHCALTSVSCGWGQHMDRDSQGNAICVANTCASNMVLQGDGVTCGCPSGTVWNGSSCQAMPTPWVPSVGMWMGSVSWRVDAGEISTSFLRFCYSRTDYTCKSYTQLWGAYGQPIKMPNGMLVTGDMISPMNGANQLAAALTANGVPGCAAVPSMGAQWFVKCSHDPNPMWKPWN